MRIRQGFAITFQWGVCPHCSEMMQGTSELPQVSMCRGCGGRLGRRCRRCDQYTIPAAPECCLGWWKYKPSEREELQKEVQEYLDYYHYERPHLGLGMQPPLPCACRI